MLRISRKLDYAFIILAHLSSMGENAKLSARDIAASHELPLPITASILKALARKGLIVSERGARGGYRLATPPKRITLERIVAAIEGPLKLADCVHDDGPRRAKRCLMVGRCPVKDPVRALHNAFRRVLGEMTLADLGR
jgi:Rrf2 family protein